jgi:hypothetical protein
MLAYAQRRPPSPPSRKHEVKTLAFDLVLQGRPNAGIAAGGSAGHRPDPMLIHLDYFSNVSAIGRGRGSFPSLPLLHVDAVVLHQHFQDCLRQ